MPDPQRAFIEAAAEGARKAARESGVPASVTLAQAALESGFGRHHLGGANNYFGIKAVPRGDRMDSGRIATGSVTVPTKEVVNGRTVTVNARFRKYASLVDSMRDHGEFLRANPRYRPAFAHSDDPDEFARALQRAGYSTDPGYADKLISIMRSFDLYRYDNGEARSDSRQARVAAYTAALQRDLNTHLRRLGAPERLAVDGEWNEETARAFRRVCRVLGIEPKRSVRTFRVIAGSAAARTPDELERAENEGVAYAERLRRSFATQQPAEPTPAIEQGTVTTEGNGGASETADEVLDDDLELDRVPDLGPELIDEDEVDALIAEDLDWEPAAVAGDDADVRATIAFSPSSWRMLTELAEAENTDRGTMLGLLIARHAHLRQLTSSGGSLLMKRGRRVYKLHEMRPGGPR